ncbi:MAG: zinc-dependent metalloprotease [Saprospiraceae bacterium]
MLKTWRREVYIRVYPHVVRMPDGSGGQTDEAIDAAFARLAADFSPHNIFFVRACDIVDVPVSETDYGLFDIYCDLWENPLYKHSDGIDMFFGPEEETDGIVGGIASNVPGKSLMAKGIWSFGGFEAPAISSSVISHEMGHCLGLWHTFHGYPGIIPFGMDCQGNNVPAPDYCCELVNGSNGTTCGDYVADTDADPYLWATQSSCQDLILLFSSSYPCIYKVSQTVTADINGDIFTPPTDNPMSYQAFLNCINTFTPGQGERMRQIIAISPVLQACLVQPDMVDVIINTNTTWTTANTPNNGDFLIEGDLTIMGGATLTINPGVRVRFGADSKVIIRPNALMRLSGTLTSMGCSQTWKGVEVRGSLPSQSQFTINGIRAQGRLEGLTGGLIENAQTAVQLYGPTTAFAGGQISCYGTTFKNNTVGVDFANYINFWPLPLPAGQQNQPRDYYGSFSRCIFITDNDYPHNMPFNSFIYLSGVNGVHIDGTTFTNERDIDGTSIHNWGYGIQSVDAGFTVTSSPDGIIFPPPSYTFSGFRGLGYAVHSQTSVVNRPYMVRQANFDRNFVGIRNWSVDGATILFNNFNLGDLPSTVPTEDAVGVIFETDVSGFTCEENEFARVTGPAVTTIGSICINTGDQHKEIRRNTYTGLHIGNLANQQNAVINHPNNPNPVFRGLYYDCNFNFNVANGTGIDFSVPNGDVRPRQGLEAFLPNGTIGYSAAGNRFSYTGIDFSNLGAATSYYFDPLSANHEPQTTQGLFQKLNAEVNTCIQSFCEPPCKTYVELEGIKDGYFAKKASLDALNSTIGTNPTEQQLAARAYYQYSMDQDAYLIALHMMYDTVHYNADSLRTWIANMNSVEGDLWLANHYLAHGAAQQANTVLDAMPTKHHLTAEKQVDIFDFKVISNAIFGQDPNYLHEAALQTIMPIAFGEDGWARGWARRLLTQQQHSWHFAPEYVKYGEEGGERQGVAWQTALASTLQIQPNPASDHVVFTMPASTAASDVLRIFNVGGKVVATFTNLQTGVDLTWQTGNTPSGVYYYHFFSDGKPHSGKILLNK